MWLKRIWDSSVVLYSHFNFLNNSFPLIFFLPKRDWPLPPSLCVWQHIQPFLHLPYSPIRTFLWCQAHSDKNDKFTGKMAILRELFFNDIIKPWLSLLFLNNLPSPNLTLLGPHFLVPASAQICIYIFKAIKCD